MSSKRRSKGGWRGLGQDPDLKELRERREWLDVLEEARGGLGTATFISMRAETKAPFRLARIFIFGGLGAGAGLGLFIITTRLIAALAGWLPGISFVIWTGSTLLEDSVGRPVSVGGPVPVGVPVSFQGTTTIRGVIFRGDQFLSRDRYLSKRPVPFGGLGQWCRREPSNLSHGWYNVVEMTGAWLSPGSA